MLAQQLYAAFWEVIVSYAQQKRCDLLQFDTSWVAKGLLRMAYLLHSTQLLVKAQKHIGSFIQGRASNELSPCNAHTHGRRPEEDLVLSDAVIVVGVIEEDVVAVVVLECYILIRYRGVIVRGDDAILLHERRLDVVVLKCSVHNGCGSHGHKHGAYTGTPS